MTLNGNEPSLQDNYRHKSEYKANSPIDEKISQVLLFSLKLMEINSMAFSYLLSTYKKDILLCWTNKRFLKSKFHYIYKIKWQPNYVKYFDYLKYLRKWTSNQAQWIGMISFLFHLK